MVLLFVARSCVDRAVNSLATSTVPTSSTSSNNRIDLSHSQHICIHFKLIDTQLTLNLGGHQPLNQF